jgi:peptidyl-prolyl cis-trans isomerase D
MLAVIRSFAKSWVAAVLIGLLIVSFAVFGINDIFKNNFRDAVVQAGSRTTSSAEEIEVREGKQVWVLKTCFVKKG